MDSADSGVTSPVLRVTAEISEIKGLPRSRDGGKYSISPSIASKDGKSNLFTKKKVLHPLYGHNPYQRSNYAGSYMSSQQNPKNNVSTFTQRVMSAKLLRVKQLQNQLAETQIKLNEVLHENKILKTLQHRQDSVLRKYEGNQEQLPQLLKSHHEEIRILTEKYKQLRISYRELEHRMKQKDNELTNLREQYKHLLKLSRDKQLDEREKLAKKVDEMESIIEQQKSKIQILDKKLYLEEKNHRHQLGLEVAKHKKTQSELNSALESLSNLKSTMEAKERFTSAPYPRYQKSIQNCVKQSHVSLPAPPRVSIRQTQRTVQSETALQPEDSETADSFTINYSPGQPCSTDSDNSSTLSRDENVDVNEQVRNKSAGHIPGGIRITKEAFKERREMRKKSTERDVKPIKLKDIKKENSKSANKRRPSKTSIKEDKSKEETQVKDKTDIDNHSQEEPINFSMEKECISVPVSHYNSNEIQQSIETSGRELHNGGDTVIDDETEEKFDENKPEVGMKIDMDSEFEKYLQNTKLTDEEISEYYKRDFRAEIYELEKKFQDLNKVSEKYIKTNKQINGTSFHIPLTEDTDSDEENAPHQKWRNFTGNAQEVQNINTIEVSENGVKPAGHSLGDSQKANLLKALSNIDESKKDAESNLEPPAHSSDALKSDGNYADNICLSNKSTTNSFSRTRRKSEIMKDLFGIEGKL